jgi:hypothetical protein
MPAGNELWMLSGSEVEIGDSGMRAVKRVIALLVMLAVACLAGYFLYRFSPYLVIIAPLLTAYIFMIGYGILNELDVKDRGMVANTTPHLNSGIRGALVTYLLYPIYVLAAWAKGESPLRVRDLM